jgi:hypothetical protein
MRTQPDPGNVVDFDPISGEQLERTRYYGCWLDFNQTVPRFPLALPADLSDGPYEDAVSILDLLRGAHQCLIAEVLAAVGSDLITIGQGPSQSDKLAQRNLAIEGVPNPGGPETRTIQAPFDLKLSRAPNIVD